MEIIYGKQDGPKYIIKRKIDYQEKLITKRFYASTSMSLTLCNIFEIKWISIKFKAVRN